MLLELISKKMNSPIKKWAKDPNRHITKEGTDQHMKRCSTSYAFGEMQIKRMLYFIPNSMVKIHSPTLDAGEDMEQQGLSFIAGGNAKWYIHFRRHFDNFLQK